MIKSIKKYYIYIFLFFSTICVSFIVFYPSLKGNFIWDDEAQILYNPYIHSLKNILIFFTGGTFYIENSPKPLEGVYYRPLMTFSYSIIYYFFGLNPTAYHTVQLFIHYLNSLLLFWLLMRLIKQKNYIIPFLLSLLFLIHPMNSETVSYIANLQDVLYFFFGISAIHVAISNINTKLQFIGTFLLLSLSLLSKETGVVFVGLILIYIYLFSKKHIKVYLSASIFVMLIYSGMRCGIAHICMSGSKPNPIGDLPFLMYLIQLPALAFYYIKTFFLPLNLAIGQVWIVQQTDWANFYMPFLFMSTILIFILYVLFKLYNQHDPYRKIYVLVTAWFLLGLSFHMHVLPLDFTVSDRWFYTPMAGMLGIVAVVINKFLPKSKMPILIFCLILIIITFSFITYKRNFDWHDNYTLFSREINKTKNSFNMENNLGVELFRKQKYDEALKHFNKAAELAPDWHTAWTNIGIIYHNKKQYKKAEYAYKKAIQQKGLYKPYQNYISLLIEQSRKKEALKFIETVALPEFPNNTKLLMIYRELKKDTVTN